MPDDESRSPEELAKQNCVFCQIVSGKVSSKKVYEDQDYVGILDINPGNPGHILLLSREHYQIMPQIPDDAAKRLFVVGKQLSQSVLKGLLVKGTTILIANGIAAGQKAPHFMMHIIPRGESDNLGIMIPKRSVPDSEIEKLLPIMRQRIAEIMGVPVIKPAASKVVEAEFTEARPAEAAKAPAPLATPPPGAKPIPSQVDLDKLTEFFSRK